MRSEMPISLPDIDQVWPIDDVIYQAKHLVSWLERQRDASPSFIVKGRLLYQALTSENELHEHLFNGSYRVVFSLSLDGDGGSRSR